MPKLNQYRIEYETLMDEADPQKRLRETLDSAVIRPRPPPTETEKLEIGEKVDAFYNDGWWNGEILKVLNSGEGGRRYAVRFPYGDGGGGMEELEFRAGEIRVHMDWIDGKWISPRVTMEGEEAPECLNINRFPVVGHESEIQGYQTSSYFGNKIYVVGGSEESADYVIGVKIFDKLTGD